MGGRQLIKSIHKDFDELLYLENDDRASIARLLDSLKEKLNHVWRCRTTEFEIKL